VRLVSGAANLPKFDRPPVFETVLGVQFNTLQGFSVLHYGLYWGKIRGSYPNYEVHPPLSPAVELFGAEAWKQPTAGLEVLQTPDIRTWFLDATGSMLLQTQKDRFLQNWRKVHDTNVYPHYEQLKPQFFSEWQTFCAFLNEVGINRPEVNQCEVTYVNHIEIQQGSKSYGSLRNVISCWSGEYSGDFLREPEAVGFNSRYLLQEKKGRLHISMQPAIRREDAKEILRLTLTARGKPASSEPTAIEEWFNIGHEWVVRGFTDVTTKEMHDMWGRTQ
jgi:uncharacterized protein (TIGR04255 family)